MDSELEPFLSLIPRADLSDPIGERKTLAGLIAALPQPDVSGLEVSDSDEPGVPVRIYRPPAAHGTIVWMHGGGFCTGTLDSEHPFAARLAVDSGAVVISVDYRLAPEHPFPAAHDDAYRVTNWAAGHVAEPGLLAVGGMSAGGGLAAGVALRARDEGGPRIGFQLLNQPVLDHRRETVSARRFTETPRMDRENVGHAWEHYLGGGPVTPYAAPALADDLSGLPPAYVAAAEFDPLRDEGIAYAARLLEAGVEAELHVWRGTFHGSHAILSAEVSQRQMAEMAAVLRSAFR
ncbi:alpha/beta hydrolase [Nonomuraea typhae]|uniref:alpha/beta hydrolase n=1 Tax=Nonomuraea typhae TaxID=2603600 RepID=UPI0012F9F3F4|nr:alpha/beta hydrolase [Nonomuraea typhae]